MSIPHHSYSSDHDAAHGALDALRAARDSGRRPVLIVPNGPSVLRARRMLAAHEDGFGTTVATLAGWAAELWQLFGDGSTLVGAEERSVLLNRLARMRFGDKATPGMGRLLSQAAAEALCFAGQTADLEGTEVDVANVLAEYRSALHERRLMEQCESYLELAHQAPCLRNRFAPVMLGCLDAPIPVAGLRFLESMGAEGYDAPLPSSGGNPETSEELRALQNLLYRRTADNAPLNPTGACIVSSTAGPSAERFALSRELAICASGGHSLLYAVKDPLGLFDFCAPHLAKHGIDALVHASVRANDTDMGRALLYLAELIGATRIDTLLAADYGLNPFSGIWYGTAFFSDKTHRGNRLIEADEVLTDLAGHAGEGLQPVVGLLEDGDFESAFSLLRANLFDRFAGRAAYASVQASVLDRAQRLCAAGAAWNIPWHEAIAPLAQATLPVRAQTGDRPTVAFVTLHDAAQVTPASYDTVVIGNLDAASYPVRDPEGALETLLGKWDAVSTTDALGSMRRTFARAIATARTSFVIERSLRNETAEDEQAALVFEEVLACYRQNLTDGEGLDPATGAPLSLPSRGIVGEENLVSNACGSMPALRYEPAPLVGEVSPEARQRIVLPRLYGKDTYPGLDLSASQIESYLECPYQWFAKRRLKLEGIEEGFGPLERGTFMHTVLEKFYRRFQADVAQKVTEDTLEAAREILEQVFAATVAEQPKNKPGNRYVPIDSWEQQVQANLLDRLVEALPFEARLLPDFTPWKFERGYGECAPYRYAGCNILGRIDRIDIDSAGNAVIIDYKSSLSMAYRLHGAQAPEGGEAVFELPQKMQALIYAKVVRDTLGCPVVGTLYVNPLKQTVLGAYDRHVIHAGQIPFTKAEAEACGVPWGDISTFDELIDRSEKMVADRMNELAAGNVAPDPLGPGACEYCPVGNCPRRLTKAGA